MSAPTPRTTPSTPLHTIVTEPIEHADPEVTLHHRKPVTTSINVAEVFGKRHKNVLRSIENMDIPPRFNGLNFEPVEFKDKHGEMRPMYEITRDGFTLLAMGFSGKPAMKFKLAYIAAFNRMERVINRRFNSEIAAVSEDRKMIRHATTDIIAEFVTYAKAQGSRHAYWYYKIFTDLINAIASPDALGPLFMSAAEHRRQSAAHICCMEAISSGMADGLEYKAIYAVAKDHLIAYADRHGWAVASLGCEFDCPDAIEAEVAA